MQAQVRILTDSYNEEQRTVDVVIATDYPARMYDWLNNVYFNEILDFSNTAIRRARLDAGLPLLDNHAKYGSVTTAVLGIVQNWRMEGTQLIGTLKISGREDCKGLLQDIKDGIVRFLSVGYNVFKYLIERLATEAEIATYRAIDWEPYECSFVTVPADPNCSVRTLETADSSGNVRQYETVVDDNDLVINHSQNNSRSMTPEQLQAERKRCTDIMNAVRVANLDSTVAESLISQGKTVEEATAEITRLKAEAGNGQTQPPNNTPPAPVADDALASERKRCATIMTAVRNAKLGVDIAERLINEGKAVEDALLEVTKLFGQDDSNGGARNHVKIEQDEADKLRERMADAILLNSNSLVKIDDPNRLAAAREFRGRRMLDLCRAVLQANGISMDGLSDMRIAQRALSTGDFAYILGSSVNRSLRAAYQLAERTFLGWARRGTANDFRPKKVTQLSGMVGSFDEVEEGAEYTAGSLADFQEQYSVLKYGKIIPITWEALINDDLGAFARIPQAIANKAAQKQSDLVYAILLNNPAMADGVALFHADHGNLAGAGAAISETSLGVSRQSFREQTDPSGDFLNLMMDFLIVGSAKETQAMQYISGNWMPATAANVNPWKNLQLVVEPRITGNEWFTAANPSVIDTIEYAFLSGEEELFTEQEQGFNSDVIKIKARMVFGAKAIDHRGLYKNPGA